MATSTISVPPADATLPPAEVVQHQDPIPGTVVGPIAFPEPEIIPINMYVDLVTTGRDSGISGMTVSNTHTENTLQPDVTTNGTVTSEPSVPATSTVDDTLDPTAVTTGQETMVNQTVQPQMTGIAVTSDVTTPTPALTSNVAVSSPMVLKTKSNHLQCVVKLYRLQSVDILKYTNASAHVNQGKENTTSMQPSQGSPDAQLHMTLHTRSTRSSKCPSCKASTSVDYTNMDVSSTESETDWKKKIPKKKPRPAMALSKCRLRAHKMSKGQAVKSEPSSSEQNDDDAHPPLSNQDNPAYQADNECDTAEDTGTKDKGKLITTQHGIIKRPKRVRNFKCKICNNVFNSMKEWNRHDEENHPLLPCLDCGKMFCNPTSLYRHRYMHTKTTPIFPCTKCDRVFPFISPLESHTFTHRKVKHFPCTAPGCQKVFKTEWNRRAHEKGHKTPETQCAHCDYSTNDLRYLKQHMRVHPDVCKHKCPHCGKGFHFYEQMKHHYAKLCVAPKAEGTD